MDRATRSGWLAGLILALGSAAFASGPWVEGADDAGEPRVAARIIAERVAGDSGRLRAGVHFRLDPGWHMYWRNPGDSGLATRIVWRDAEASALSWPAPEAFEEADGELVTFGYAGEVVLAAWLQPALGAQELGADVDVLVCRASCIPATLSLRAPLELSSARGARVEIGALFAAHDAALPLAPDALGVGVQAERASDAHEARVRITPCAGDGSCSSLSAAAGPAFFPDFEGELTPRLVAARAEAGALLLRVRSESAALPERLRGVVALEDAGGALRHLELDVPIDAAAAPPPERPAAVGAPAFAELLAMLGLGLLGGLLLNLMPCVLPVLALKVFAVSELAGRSRRAALQHGLAYAGGVQLSMLALAAIATLLRSAGHAVGWGFQFQEPAYVAGISAVLVGFALNLLGVFEIGFAPSALAEVGGSASGARRSFFEGLLAVALATPCSAPFLGTALGFAFAGSALISVLIFLAIGAGLSLPFVAIAAFPRFARFLPRSGAWMGHVRSALGFALLATVVWLLWIVGRSAGADAVVALLGVLLAGAFIAWLYGRVQYAGLRFASLSAALAVGVLVIGGANLVRVNGAARAVAGPALASDAAFSEAQLHRALAAGRPVFAYFTADWCLTCKLNERIALHTEATREALAAGRFTVLRGDWTQRDEAIRRELARHGKAGVPLYLVYAPSRPDRPAVLPELLSQERLLDALRSVAK